MTNIFDLINKKKATLSGKKETIKPNAGNNFFVILPSWKGQGEFWKDCNRHWIKNSANEVQAVCACTMAETGHCDICNAIAVAKSKYNTDPIFSEMIAQWTTNRRVLFNVLEVENVQTAQGVAWRAKDISDVKVLEVPITLATAIFDAMNGLSIQGISDPVDLNCIFPINVVKSGSGKQNTKYSASLMMTPIRFNAQEIATITNSLKNLDDFVAESDEAHGRALASMTSNLGDNLNALPSGNASVQMISAPMANPVNNAAPVTPIVEDLGQVINDQIPNFGATNTNVVEEPVKEISPEQLDNLLSSI